MLFKSQVTLSDAESVESKQNKAEARELLIAALSLLAKDDPRVAEFLASYSAED